MPRFATIVATGSYLAEIEITNDLLRARFSSETEKIDNLEALTGIRRRWYAPEDWATSDLALAAARQSLERAGRKSEDVDLMILGS